MRSWLLGKKPKRSLNLVDESLCRPSGTRVVVHVTQRSRGGLTCAAPPELDLCFVSGTGFVFRLGSWTYSRAGAGFLLVPFQLAVASETQFSPALR